MYISNDRSSFIGQLIKKNHSFAQRVLELGCNDGATLRGLIDEPSLRVVDIYGVDYERPVKLLIEDKKFKQLDLNKNLAQISQQISAAEIILILDVLEHLNNPEQILTDIARIKSKAALVIISVPNFSSIRMLAAWLRSDFPRNKDGYFDKTHRSWFSMNSLIREISSSYEEVDKGYIFSKKRLFKLIQLIMPSRLTSQFYVVIR